ncbi:MAG: hypothetical protein AAGA56_26085 [Myxococcota bacterium]
MSYTRLIRPRHPILFAFVGAWFAALSVTAVVEAFELDETRDELRADELEPAALTPSTVVDVHRDTKR